MASLTYYEDDVFGGIEIDDADIRECADVATLLQWFEDCEASMSDIFGQIEVAALGGQADGTWLYRAGKAAGFFRRAQSRIKSRMVQLGVDVPDVARRVRELIIKLDAVRADAKVAREFHRLAQEGGIPRSMFDELEARTLRGLAEKRKNLKAQAAQIKLGEAA